MSAIATSGTSSGLSAVAQLLSNSTSPKTDGGAQGGQASASKAPATSAADGTGPAAFVTLSNQAKAAAAARVKSDQAAAESLQAFVEAHHVNVTGNGAKAPAAGSLQSILSANTQPTAAQPGNGKSTTSSAKVEAVVAQITTLTDANEPPPFQSFTPTKSLSNSLTVDGITLTIDTNAGTQFYGYKLSGAGVDAFNDHFGPSAGVSSGNGVTPGVVVSGETAINNNEAVESVTITRNVAAASSASISSSAGSASASAVSAQSSSVTFLLNYATGQISAKETALSVSAQAAQITPPGSTVSTLA
jgi:hypothetical protein